MRNRIEIKVKGPEEMDLNVTTYWVGNALFWTREQAASYRAEVIRQATLTPAQQAADEEAEDAAAEGSAGAYAEMARMA